MFQSANEYWADAVQRVLFWDVMRRRGYQYREHLAETAPDQARWYGSLDCYLLRGAMTS